ncbi:MAG: ComEC/Rec2 family competence protein [Actinomycetota bacterium]|nr:ComEC/Rec2 family competence protein [Actinomycetota bacterium]
MALAVCATAGAASAVGVPLWLGVGTVALALALRRPALLCVGAAVLASALGARSWEGLRPPVPSPVSGVATLVTDPVDVEGALRVEARLGGRRVEAWARGADAGRLRPRLAGQRVEMAGRLSAVPERSRSYLASRHVAARLTVRDVGAWSDGGPLARVANGVRRTLLRGASSLPDGQRALFAGLVLGDDREQDVGTVDDFRATGLSHLLAVSGQNVAFVLALSAPLLRPLGLRGRFLAALAVLILFGALTRWEPSVLRAEAMASVSLLAAMLGRPATTIRVLALAVTGLVLVDPLLVRSVGFLLSCGACAGIAILGPPLSRRLPLPLAVTLAAQAGVSPLLAPVFGGVPLASVPANLLAAPAAGPVMMWGLAAGLPAGLLGEPWAGLLHLPTRLLVAWVAAVARLGAALPLGQLRTPHLVVLAVPAVLAVVLPRLRIPALTLGAAACAWVTVAPRPGPSGDVRSLADGADLWRRGGAVVLVVDRPRPRALLSGLRRAGVRHLDVVAVRSPGRSAGPALAPVLDRHPARVLLTPATATPGSSLTAGGLRVDVVSVRPRLDVRVSPARNQ